MSMVNVKRPIPLPYTFCSQCKFEANSDRVIEDCGRHSMEYAWSRLVESLEKELSQMRNERDYYKSLHEAGDRAVGNS